jgi:hypothetical protein
MSINKTETIHILDTFSHASEVVFQFVFQQRIYSLSMKPDNTYNLDKIKLLNIFIAQNNSTVHSILKIRSNSSYLIFKVRYKLNWVAENFVFTASVDFKY